MNSNNDSSNEQTYLELLGDLLAGLIFIFIISIVAISIKLSLSKTKDVKTYKNILDSRKKLLVFIKNYLNERGITVGINVSNGTLMFPAEPILFRSGEQNLTQQGTKILRIFSEGLKESIDCKKTKIKDICFSGVLMVDSILVEGHSDPMKIINKSEKVSSNLDLSVQRSLSAFNVIYSEVGYLKNQKGEFILGVSAYGDKRPFIESVSRKCRKISSLTKRKKCFSRDRRIDIRFLMSEPKPWSEKHYVSK